MPGPFTNSIDCMHFTLPSHPGTWAAVMRWSTSAIGATSIADRTTGLTQ